MAEQRGVPSVEALIERVKQVGKPAAFQALWDGDSGGWMAIVQAVLTTNTGYYASNLAILRFGGDERLLRGSVPPWPEAKAARELGDALSTHFGVAFWFPSPAEPDDACPSWWERDRAHPCKGCGKLILPRNTPHLPDEVCYSCYLKLKARAKLRRDDPTPEGVYTLFGAPGSERRISYTAISHQSSVVRFALDTPEAARGTSDLVVEGEQLSRLEAYLDREVRRLLVRFEGRPANERCPIHRPEYRGEIEIDGRKLEFDRRLDKIGNALAAAVEYLALTRRALRDSLRYWLIFSLGLAERGAKMLRLLRMHKGAATVAVLAEGCGGDLNAGEVRGALSRLAELGHAEVNGDHARLLPTGWHVGG